MPKRVENHDDVEDPRFLSTAAKRKRHVLGVIPSPDGGLECDATEILILDLLTVGTEVPVVARRFGMAESEIRGLAESARGVKYIAGKVVERKEGEVHRRRQMDGLVGKALDTYEAILERPEDQRIAAKVAGDILDRDPARMFPRTQRVEHGGGRGVIDLDAVAERVVGELRGEGVREVEFEEVDALRLPASGVVPPAAGDGEEWV